MSNSYCINFFCEQPENPGDVDICQTCNTSLIFNGRYKLRKQIKSSKKDPKALIYIAEDLSTQQQKVIKMTRTKIAKEIELFEREAYALQHLHDKGLPGSELLSDFTIQLEYCLYRCLVMEYIPGTNLLEWLSENRLTTDEQVIDWLKQMVDILHTMHTNGYFHRDIKPENIVLDEQGRLVLIDLGAVRKTSGTYLARISLDTEDLSDELGITRIFSFGYAPPEQLEYRAIPQSDIYALAKTLIHLLTGIHPIRLPQDEQTGKTQWRNLAPTISPPLADLIDQMCKPLPIQRPHTTAVLQNQIKQLPTQVRRYRFARQPLLWLTVGVSILAVVLGLAEGGRRWYVASRLGIAGEAFQTERYIDAKQALDSAVFWAPSNPDIRYRLARTCSFIGDLTCTEDQYEAAIRLQPNNTELLFLLGDYYEDRNLIAKAKSSYKRAIAIDPVTAIQARNNLARLQIIEGQPAKALKTLGESPNSTLPSIQTSWWKNQGWALKELGQRDAAIESLQKSISVDLLNTSANCLLGELLEDKKHWKICLTPSSRLPEVTDWRARFLDKVLSD